MKHRKLLLITSVLLVLSMSAMFLFACGKDSDDNGNTEVTPPEEEKEPEITVYDVVERTREAIFASFAFDKSKPVGLEYSMKFNVNGVKNTINIKGYLDTKTTSSSEFYIDYLKNDKKQLEIALDDEYLFVTTDSVFRRIKGFELASVLQGQTLPNNEDISGSFVGAVLSMAMDFVFDSEEFDIYESNGVTTTVINGDLDTIVSILGGLLDGISPGLGDSITSALSGINVKLTTNIRDGKVENMDLLFKVGEERTLVNFTSKLDNFEPVITIPSKTDDRYIESKALNFVLEGQVDMATSSQYVDTVVATYGYEIYVDLDIFAMLRNAIIKDTSGNITFDASKLFDLEDSNLYINLSHICNDGHGCNKLDKGNGSILTLAYSKKAFGNNDFYISANPLAILPKGFLDEGLGLDEDLVNTIAPLLKGQFGTNISPAALFTSLLGENTASEMATTYRNGTLNIVGVISKVLDFIASSRLDNGALRMDIDSIVNLIDEFSPIMDVDVNIPMIVRQFFGDADYMYIGVDRAEYGVPELENLKYYEMFMIIDENVGEYKFTNGGPALEVSPVLDTEGNIVIESTNKSIKRYDVIDNEDGTKSYKPLPMSKAEMEMYLASNLQVRYSYKTVTGAKGEATAFVNEIRGLDLDKAGKQDVTIITNPLDSAKGGTVGGLQNLLKNILKIDIKIPGKMFVAKMEVVQGASIELSQKDEIGGKAVAKYDKDKTYSVGDKLYSKFDVKISYPDTEYVKVIENVEPKNMTNLFDNANKVDNSQVRYTKSFKLDFGSYGALDVKVNEYTPIENKEILLKTGEMYKFPSKIEYSINGGSSTISATKSNVSFEGADVREYMNTSGILPKFEYHFVTFQNAGTYNVVRTFNNGVSETYTFVVEDEIILPTFVLDIKESKGDFNVTVARENNIQDIDSVLVALRVEGKSTVAPETEEVITRELVYGEDFAIEVDGVRLDKAEMNIRSFQGMPETFKVVMLNDDFKSGSINITLLAKEYEMKNIGGGQLKFA